VSVLLEIAVTTPDEAMAAVAAGADRLELGAGLELGGLTPSLGIFARVRELVDVPVWVLLRPRPGGFDYTAEELAAVRLDAEQFLARGADGIVFGALDAAGRVAIEPSRQLAELAGGRIAFHRAFDFLLQPLEAVEQLIELGFRRILTSGGGKTALEGKRVIAELIARAAGRLEILPGGGINAENVAQLVRETGCTQVHAAVRTKRADHSLRAQVELASTMGAPKANTTTTDPSLVAALRRELLAITTMTACQRK